MATKSTRAVAVLGVLLLLLLAGCGADESAEDGGDTAAAPTAAPVADGGESDGAPEGPMGNPCADDASPEMAPPPPAPPAEGAEIVEVSAADYAFDGMADTYAAGDYGFVLDNPAEEIHELILFRIAEGEQRPITELLALPEEEAGAAAEMVGMGFACPGETAEPLGVELTAGRYAAVCFLPTGSTPEADMAEIGEHAPHFTEGMVHEFSVT